MILAADDGAAERSLGRIVVERDARILDEPISLSALRPQSPDSESLAKNGRQGPAESAQRTAHSEERLLAQGLRRL